MAAWSDEAIVDRLQRGDETAVEALLRRHGPSVKGCLAVCFRLPHHDDDLEDAVHDAALIMFRRARRLDPGASIRGYMLTTARRELMRARRRRGATTVTLGDRIDQQPHAPPRIAPGPTSLAVRQLMDALPRLEREVLMLDHGSDFAMTAREVARATGTSVGAVFTLRHRTRQRLRALIAGLDARQAPTGRRRIQ